MDNRIKEIQARRIKDGHVETVSETVTCESPLTVYLDDRELVTLLCTPEYLDELAVGFLHSEGFLKTRDDLGEIKVDTTEGTVRIKGRKPAIIAGETFLKRYITTGCGKGTSFYHLSDAICPPVETDFRIKSSSITGLMIQAQRLSKMFQTTGGVHSSAVCTAEEIVFFREDVGRHNTVDKLIGRCFLDGADTRDRILLTTGRISSEILVKTAKMGIPLVASRSAPTDLAIRHAGELGVTIAAFVRNRRMNIYSHPERVLP